MGSMEDFLNHDGKEYRHSVRSTLVETVSINYEDFNESFLTCSTCLCMFDAGEHCPKLLPCSHTVCIQCLQRIVATDARELGFRCPICRELIRIPAGGVVAIPPSFLVNQLIDLMAKQIREVIPNCSTHENQELMLCETCDSVFCTLCTGGSHVPEEEEGNNNQSSTADHTVIPLSIARKRMSEIVIYKANECSSKLNAADTVVNEEIDRLEHLADAAFNSVNRLFEELGDVMEKKRIEVIGEVRRRKDEKKQVLEQQLKQIEAEKSDVQTNVTTIKHQVDVKNVTTKISELNSKIEAISQLSEPRENSYIEFHRIGDKSFEASVNRLLKDIGRIKTSKTFPSLCRATMETAICNLETIAVIQTLDFHGNIQDSGGDPITAEVITDKGSSIETEITDLENGSYEVRFTPGSIGTYCLKVFIFARPIKDCPLFFEVTRHNSPILSFGSHGSENPGFIQPCSIAVDRNDFLYIVDTGNSRIKVLTSNFDFSHHITNEHLEGRSVTGVCLGTSKDSLVTVNWRTKMVSEMSLEGKQIGAFTHKELVEPIAVAINPDGDFVVADNGVGVLVFEPCGKLIRKIGKKGAEKGEFRELFSVCVSQQGEIIVADTRIVVFDKNGKFIREFGWKTPKEGSRGRYQGLAMDNNGLLLAVRSDKAGSYIQVFNYQEGTLHSVIDSHGSKLKRPTGISVSPSGDRHAYLVDIGNECVRKFRYK